MHTAVFACMPMSAGATGGVGKRVVQRLLEQGKVVRALVRDVDKAKSLLVSKAGCVLCRAFCW
jgi:uncharacterized protein YbjT (DUF2867 family)